MRFGLCINSCLGTLVVLFYRHIYSALSFHEAFEGVTLDLHGKIITFSSILKRNATQIYQSLSC